MGADTFWAGSSENIAAREREITADEALHAATNIVGAIGHDESVRISGFMAVEAVAGLRALAALKNAAPEPIDLKHEYELRVIVSDLSAWRERLEAYGFPADEVRRIFAALSVERGVSLNELLQLMINASVSRVRAEVGRFARYLPCNIEPACNLELGHDGECDLEIPF